MKRAWLWPIGAGISIAVGAAVYSFPIWYEGTFVGWSLIDDAMISLTYARNLVKGCGLVWQCGGERVEGYTNLGWVLYMALWHWVGLSEKWAGLPIVLTGAVTLGLHLRAVYLVAREIGGEGVALWASWIGALFLPLIFHHISGLEAGFLAMLLTYWAYWTIKGEVKVWVYAIVAALGTLVRMDFILGVVAIGIAGAWLYQKEPQRIIPFIGAIGVAFLVGGATTLWRVSYYKMWVPNTYVLKVSSLPISWRIWNGTFSFLMHVLMNIPLWLAAGIGFWFLRGSSRILPLLAVSGIYLLYNTYVGGDIYETSATSNRFLLNAFPLLFVLSGYALERLSLHFVLKILAIGFIAYGTPRLKSDLLFHRWKNFVDILGENQIYFINLDQFFSHNAVVMVGRAGLLPYFHGDKYIWRDYLGKTDTSVAQRGHLVLCNGRPGYLYFPGHTRHDVLGLWRVDGAVQLVEGPICDPHREGPRWQWKWALPLGATHCPATLPSYFPFPSAAVRDSFCQLFDLVEPNGSVWRRRKPTLLSPQTLAPVDTTHRPSAHSGR
ncbi:MAG: hypothetical protein N3A68_01025 [Bacteroidia bacterium]|nr:hypothetical protein [Bacteroidia bacterium]